MTTALALGGALVSITVFCDLFNANSARLVPIRQRLVRLFTWLPIAAAYAGYYFGRYNIAAMNVPAVRALLDLSEMQFGVIIAAGMWTYAVTAPITGGLVRKMGGWKAVQLGCAGAGLANLSVLLVRACIPSDSNSWVLTSGVAIAYAANLGMQGFGTSASLSLASSWYADSERGLFSGLFNVWINFGYLLALTSEVKIVAYFGWSWAFALPGVLLLVFAAALVFVQRQSPLARATIASSSLPVDACASSASSSLQQLARPLLVDETGTETAAKTKRSGPPASSSDSSDTASTAARAAAHGSTAYRELFGIRIFIRYLLAISMLTWVRDGLITWILSFLNERGLVSADGTVWLDDHLGLPPPNDAIGLAIFVGGATGGVTIGAISDSLFRSDRRPPLLIFTLAQAAALGALGPHMVTGIALAPAGAVACVWAVCFFALGNYSLLCYAVPTDLGERRVALAVGVMTGAQYLSSGLGAVVLGALVSRYGFTSWWLSMELATAAQLLAIWLI
jgi:sugar phosphate permease